MDDLISRRAAIKAIDDLPNCYNGYSDTYDKAYIIAVLEELPSIMFDTESWKITVTDTPMVEYAPVKHGKWVEPSREIGWSYDQKAYAECSVCCNKEFLGWGKAFCPNCGAKMDEVEE